MAHTTDGSISRHFPEDSLSWRFLTRDAYLGKHQDILGVHLLACSVFSEAAVFSNRSKGISTYTYAALLSATKTADMARTFQHC